MAGYRFADMQHCVSDAGEVRLLNKSGDDRSTQRILARVLGDMDGIGRKAVRGITTTMCRT
jgi:hypothetical protein